MLDLKNICFTRDGKKILNDVNIKLDDNKFIVITGPNGSGKSTLAKIIMGIEKADNNGQVIFNGQDISMKSIDERANSGISFAFQQPVKFKGITVYDLLKLSAGKEISRKDACDILSKVGLCAKEYVDREVNNSLSGGELKRIEIATVAVRNAKLTIFDEPEAGIDLWSFDKLNSLFENNKTYLIVSHQEKLLNRADKILVLKNGKIEKYDTASKVLNLLNQSTCKRINGGV